MKVSVCITVLNEEKNIGELLEFLLNQKTKPDEVVVVDGGSSDKTVEIIKHFEKKDKRVRLLEEKSTRAEGRNLAVEIARNEIIAMTDAGCVPEKVWLGRLIEPFKNEKVDMVAGFYKMGGDSPIQRASSVFLGTKSENFDVNFLPSTRSVAFRKELWERVGGFPEGLKGTAEDTVFTHKALKSGTNIARVKNARVGWEMPRNLSGVFKKMQDYAKGDVQSKLFWHRQKKLTSHNIKVLFVFFRYLIGLILIFMAFKNPLLWYLVIFLLIFYIFWAFRKVFIYEKDYRVALWGVILQFTADLAVMIGFAKGIIDS